MKIKGGNAYEKPGHQLAHSQEINEQGDLSFFKDFVTITWDHVWRHFVCCEWAAQVWVITILLFPLFLLMTSKPFFTIMLAFTELHNVSFKRTPTKNPAPS